MKFSHIVICTTVCTSALAIPSLASAQTPAPSATAASSVGQVDKEFVEAASMASSTEVDASKLALHNTNDKDVKSFAHRMMVDHTKLAMQLKLAVPHDVTVPKDNPDTAMIDSLKGLKGKAFDDAYISRIGLVGHKEAVAAFEKEISDGQDGSLKKAAKNALPTIQKHYQMAQDLAAKKGVSQ
ncbi:DUF4142 domain-containing protein [Paraburkholderia phymatum]|uniref:DUF4142 domain-containing protein n=1 Tax=Paraburkholderia phymatum TaxID=148447 RepID=UPI0031824494